MNSKNVLSRIAKILTLSYNTPIQAKTEDGKILQSSNFDVNDDVMEVGEDGKLTPVADGEYTITFTTPEGEDSTQVIDIDGGKIAAIETVDESAQEKSGASEEENEEEEEEMGGMKMSDEKKGALVTDEAHSLPNTTDEDPRNRIGPDTDDEKDPIISLSYRIDELESKLADMYEKMNSAFPSEGMEVSSLTPTPSLMSKEEEELPKLNGAPIDPIAKFASQNRNNFGKKSDDYQNNFLNKLYK
jgi:hypothetical protein